MAIEIRNGVPMAETLADGYQWWKDRAEALEAELKHERYLRERDNDELVKYQKKIVAENQRLREAVKTLRLTEKQWVKFYAALEEE